MTLEKKVCVLEVFTYIFFAIFIVNYYSESSIWNGFDKPAGFFEYVVAFIVLVFFCMADYAYTLEYAMRSSFTAAVVQFFLTWFIKYILFGLVMFFPTIFFS